MTTPWGSQFNRNVFWTLSDRIGRLLISFATGIVVARLLTPELYGVFSFANALVSVVAFLNIAAIEAMVVWALVREPEQKEAILGSALLLRLLGGLATVLAVYATLPFLGEQPPVVVLIAPIIAAASLFNAMEVGEYWLRQILASKYGVIARQVALAIGAGGRVWAADSNTPLLGLAIMVVLEALLAALGLTLALRRMDTPPWRWRIEWRRCRQLLVDAQPLLLAAAAVGLYARIGVIILGQSQGVKAVGLFSVATIMVEATHAVPVAIMASVAPFLLARRLDSESIFRDQFIYWLRRLTWLGIAICLTLHFLAPILLSLLFGSRYDGSIAIFEILVWSALFVFISAVSETWIVGHALQRYQLPKTLVATAVSIALNLNLAPTLGGRGTAIATLVAYSVSALWANALFRNTRPLFRLQLRALIPPIPWTTGREGS